MNINNATSGEEQRRSLRAKGISYDTGFIRKGATSRECFDSEVVKRELRIIRDDLHCNAVRVIGGDPERLELAATFAAELGLEVWFSPYPLCSSLPSTPTCTAPTATLATTWIWLALASSACSKAGTETLTPTCPGNPRWPLPPSPTTTMADRLRTETPYQWDQRASRYWARPARHCCRQDRVCRVIRHRRATPRPLR